MQLVSVCKITFALFIVTSWKLANCWEFPREPKNLIFLYFFHAKSTLRQLYRTAPLDGGYFYKFIFFFTNYQRNRTRIEIYFFYKMVHYKEDSLSSIYYIHFVLYIFQSLNSAKILRRKGYLSISQAIYQV